MPLLPTTPDLPVRAVMGELTHALADATAAVLVAPPGAGKTTLVPLALADQPWAAGSRILVLEPRRLAARQAARRMAALTGTAVGATIGHRMRGDTRVSAATRVEVVTEGVLVRMLHADPALEGVAAVVFDEFHERSLDADVGLAFAADVQRTLRDDLRLVVMSATIDAEPVARALGGAPVVVSDGRAHPVRTVFRPAPADRPWDRAVVDAVVEILPGTGGDVLVFCPGAAEIGRVGRLLGERVDDRTVAVLPLHGTLPAAEQDRALDPDPAGRRKVVLATAIAETSLTIDGVRVVVDGGLARVPRFDIARGMGRLETVRVGRAAADQRRGRAGRQVPGVCVRLWSEAEDARLLPAERPEITVADLTALAVDLARWGTPFGEGLVWLDPPTPMRLGAARTLLTELGVLDAAGRLTDHGRAVGELPLHPRLGHALLRGHAPTAALVAALLGERDVRRGASARTADLADRVDAVLGRPGGDVDRATAARVRTEAERVARLVGSAGAGRGADARHAVDTARLGEQVALAYPERLAQRRPGDRHRYLLANGTGAALDERDPLAGEPWLAVADLDAGASGGDARIRLAAPVDAERVAADRIVVERVVGWDDATGDVVAEQVRRLGAIVLQRSPALDVTDADRVAAVLEGIRRRGLALLPWTDATRRWRARVDLLARHLGAPWPRVDDEGLLATLDDWLGPHLRGVRRRSDLARVDLAGALEALLAWPLHRQLDELAPERIEVPSGSRIAVDYDADPPVLAVKLQELFGWTTTPTVGGGRVPLVVHLLSPAGRPVQVTADLASFWANGYAAVRAELRGRYPKHPWPEDPLTAVATARAKPRPGR